MAEMLMAFSVVLLIVSFACFWHLLSAYYTANAVNRWTLSISLLFTQSG